MVGGELGLSDQGTGNSVASVMLDRAGAGVGSSGCAIEFISWSPLLEQMIGEILDADRSGRIGLMNACVTQTLSGELDWRGVGGSEIAVKTWSHTTTVQDSTSTWMSWAGCSVRAGDKAAYVRHARHRIAESARLVPKSHFASTLTMADLRAWHPGKHVWRGSCCFRCS